VAAIAEQKTAVTAVPAVLAGSAGTAGTAVAPQQPAVLAVGSGPVGAVGAVTDQRTPQQRVEGCVDGVQQILQGVPLAASAAA
jgi:hypothetical protein